MSADFKGLSCVRCRSYLFEEDDVVFCPTCGAPHHRDCYNSIGHCALEELHGTENEYSREKVTVEQIDEKTEEINTNNVKCQMCGEEYNSELGKCPQCAAPNFKGIGGFGQFDFLGGVPADYDLGDGITADEAKKFVVANTHRYIPKFAILNKKKKSSWNWMAFLFPSGWMLSRKMYKCGIITALLTIAANCLAYPLNLKLYNLNFIQNGRLTVEMSEIVKSIPEIGVAVIILALISGVCDLGIRLFSAIMGDYMYKGYSLRSIKLIKEESTDVVADYRKKGGVNLLLFLVGSMLVQYGTIFIQILFF